jgi:hypothetical protein
MATTASPDQPDPDRILAGYRALLEPSGITDAFLRETLQIYPELLSGPAGELGRAVAFIQPAEQGRDSVLRVVALLEACREIGVEAAIREHRRAAGLLVGKDRAQAQAAAARQRSRGRKGASPAEAAPWASGAPFPSLAECREWFEQAFGQETIRMKVKSVAADGEVPFEAEVPRYVYRGESGVFAKTLSSLDRVIADPRIPAPALQDILSTTLALRRDLQASWGLPPLLAEGFLQHYGMPTHDFDVSQSIDVACSFGSDLGVGEMGALCAMPTEPLVERMRLVDLRDHPKADRPRRQQALVITDPERVYRDLKNPDTVAACGIHWARFVMTDSDRAEFNPDPWLLDGHSDPAAGLIGLLISSYEQMDDGAAQWIADRLQPAPFVFITVPDPSNPGRVALDWVSADEAGIPYVEMDSRAHNRKYWSRRFPRPAQQKLPAELLADPHEISASPGRVLRVLSRRGLEEIGILKPFPGERP